MRLPYPAPEAIKTKKRCQYSLPGRRYNCRCLGKFVLNGKGYCAPHYHAAWSFQNPVLGPQHEWHLHVNRFTGVVSDYQTCRRCAVIRVIDGLAQGPCCGKMPVIILRA